MLEEVAMVLMKPFKAIYSVWHWNLDPGADLCPRG